MDVSVLARVSPVFFYSPLPCLYAVIRRLTGTASSVGRTDVSEARGLTSNYAGTVPFKPHCYKLISALGESVNPPLSYIAVATILNCESGVPIRRSWSINGYEES